MEAGKQMTLGMSTERMIHPNLVVGVRKMILVTVGILAGGNLVVVDNRAGDILVKAGTLVGDNPVEGGQVVCLVGK